MTMWTMKPTTAAMTSARPRTWLLKRRESGRCMATTASLTPIPLRLTAADSAGGAIWRTLRRGSDPVNPDFRQGAVIEEIGDRPALQTALPAVRLVAFAWM